MAMKVSASDNHSVSFTIKKLRIKRHRCNNLLVDRFIQFRSNSAWVEEESVGRSGTSLAALFPLYPFSRVDSLLRKIVA